MVLGRTEVAVCASAGKRRVAFRAPPPGTLGSLDAIAASEKERIASQDSSSWQAHGGLRESGEG